MTRNARVILLALVLVAVPLTTVAQAQDQGSGGSTSESISFYGHVFGHGMGGEGNVGPQPANTEFPTGENLYGVGSLHYCTPAGTATNAPSVEPGEDCESDEENTLVLFSTPGTVDVETTTEFEQEGGYAQFHNERGQTKDIVLGDDSVTARLFLTVDAHGWFVGNGYGTFCAYPHPVNVPCAYPYWGWDVGAQPNFQVQATLYKADLGSRSESSTAPPIHDALESGDAEVVAQGAEMMSMAANGLPGTPKALEFNIDLGTPAKDTIERTKDFFLVYRFYSEANGEAVGPGTWRIWSGEFFPPTFQMPVENQLAVERVIPTFANQKLAILGVVNTPWGSYDVKSGSVDMTIEDQQGNTVQPQKLTTSGLSRSLAHGGHYVPVNKTWIWDYKDEPGLQPGNYTVTVDAANLQGSATASCSATFVLEENQQGRLVAGETNPGSCGFQTLSEERAQELKEGVGDAS